MKALFKAHLTFVLLSIAGSLHGQTTLFTFNTTPIWSSTYSYSNATHFGISTGGATGSASKYLNAKLTSAGGGGIRVFTVSVPKISMIQVSGYMRAPLNAKPWSMNFAYKLGVSTASSFNTEPATWGTVMSFSDVTVNGNGNAWVNYSVQFSSGTDSVISLAFSLVSDTTMNVGFDEVSINPLYILPVQLTYFNAEKIRQGVQLMWGTASEINNSGFDVERSSDAVAFNSIATIAGHGNSQEKISYSYLDNEPLNGDVYYRLRQVDFNGQATYSSIIKVNGEQEKASGLKVYPNPFNNELHWTYNSMNADKYTLRFTDMSGKQIYTRNVEGQQEGLINLDGSLPHGIYILSVDDGISSVQRAMVVH